MTSVSWREAASGCRFYRGERASLLPSCHKSIVNSLPYPLDSRINCIYHVRYALESWPFLFLRHVVELCMNRELWSYHKLSYESHWSNYLNVLIIVAVSSSSISKYTMPITKAKRSTMDQNNKDMHVNSACLFRSIEKLQSCNCRLNVIYVEWIPDSDLDYSVMQPRDLAQHANTVGILCIETWIVYGKSWEL